MQNTAFSQTGIRGKVLFFIMTGIVCLACLLLCSVRAQAATAKITFNADYFKERYAMYGAEAVADTSSGELDMDFLTYELPETVFTSVKSMDSNIVSVVAGEEEGIWYLIPKAAGMTTLVCQENGATTGLYDIRVSSGYQKLLINAQKTHESTCLKEEWETKEVAKLEQAAKKRQEAAAKKAAEEAAQAEQSGSAAQSSQSGQSTSAGQSAQAESDLDEEESGITEAEWKAFYTARTRYSRFVTKSQLNTVNYGDTKLTGKAYSGTVVKVTIGGLKTFTVKAGKNGTFTVKGISKAKAGAKITAIFQYKNQKCKKTARILRGSTVSNNEVVKGTKKVSFTATNIHKGDYVLLTLDGKTYRKKFTKKQASKTFKIKLKKAAKSGRLYTVTYYNAAGQKMHSYRNVAFYCKKTSAKKAAKCSKTEWRRRKWLFGKAYPKKKSQMLQYLDTFSVNIIDARTHKKSTMQLTMHRALIKDVQAIFNQMVKAKFEIDPDATMAFNWREMASGSAISHHSYGIVVDVNWNNNGASYMEEPYLPGKDPLAVTPKIVKMWKKQGFFWGGDWSRKYFDPMHFTYTNH